YRERQPNVHAARIALHRRIEKLINLGEGDDLVKFLSDLAAAHPQDRAVEIDVLSSGQFGVKSGADLQQAADAAANLHFAATGLGDSRQDFQQRALAGAVSADDPHHLPRLDFEG